MAHLLFRGLTQNLKAAKLEVHASEYFIKYSEIVHHQLIRFASSNDGNDDRQGTSKSSCKSTPYKCEVIVFNSVQKNRCSVDNKSTLGCRKIPFKFGRQLCRPKAVQVDENTDNRYCQSVPFEPNFEVYNKEEEMMKEKLKAMNNEGRVSANPEFKRIEFEPPKECPKMSSHWDPDPAPIENEQEENPAKLYLHEMSNSDSVQDKSKECPRTSSRHFDAAPNREYKHLESAAKSAHFEVSNRDNERLQKTSSRHWLSAPPREYEDVESSAIKECPRTSPRSFEAESTGEYEHMESSAKKECPRTSSRHLETEPTGEYEHMENSVKKECPSSRPFEAAPTREYEHMGSSVRKECPRTSLRPCEASPTREYEHISPVKLELYEMSKCDKTNAHARPKKIDEMTPLWYIQRTVSASLALLVPAALANPCPTLDVFLASALVMHNYWSLEAFCEDYVNQSKFAEMPPGVVPVVLVILSGLTLAGLLSLIHKDVGIAQAILCLWKLQEHCVECPPTKKTSRW